MANKYIPILILSSLISQITGFFNLMIYQNKKTGYVATAMIISSLVNVILNYFFIEHNGVIFAAISTIAATIINFILIYVHSKKHFFVDLDWISLLPLLLIYIAVIVGNRYFLNQELIYGISFKVACTFLLFFLYKKFFINAYRFFKGYKLDV